MALLIPLHLVRGFQFRNGRLSVQHFDVFSHSKQTRTSQTCPVSLVSGATCDYPNFQDLLCLPIFLIFESQLKSQSINTTCDYQVVNTAATSLSSSTNTTAVFSMSYHPLKSYQSPPNIKSFKNFTHLTSFVCAAAIFAASVDANASTRKLPFPSQHTTRSASFVSNKSLGTIGEINI